MAGEAVERAGVPPTGDPRLDALIRLATLARAAEPGVVLDAVGVALRDVGGYRSVVVNVYDAGRDRYVVGSVAGLATEGFNIDGASYERTAIERSLFRAEFQLAPNVYFIAAGDGEYGGLRTHVSPILVAPAVDVAAGDRWNEEDVLVIALTTADGRPLGMVSLDHPGSGLRPTRDDVGALLAMAAAAAGAIEDAQVLAEAQRHGAALRELIAFSQSPGVAASPEAIATQACTAARQLGYNAVAVLFQRVGRLQVSASAGMRPQELDELEQSAPLHEAFNGAAVDADGCAVLDGAPYDHPTGRGPHAWGRRRLAAPLREARGPAGGVIVVDRPVDALAPTEQRRLELRLLADRTMAAVVAARQRDELQHLATHDELTGLANRRAIDEAIDAVLARGGGTALVLFDLDRFKGINDRYGHEEGDRALSRFGRHLASSTPPGATAGRLGGEEFVLVLPGATASEARALADRIRTATPQQTAGSTPGVTVSAGVTHSAGAGTTRREFVAAADRALYRAKHAGRDRIEIEPLEAAA
ncbi:MAG: GGDEF domain-containing protein [Solirubrobacteraceae bacterium]|nr:GGDEF domain-containing protein [Solirubrobacteraceae bacterium]